MSSFNLFYFGQKLVSKVRRLLAEPLSPSSRWELGYLTWGIPAALLGFMIFRGFSLEAYFHCRDHQKVSHGGLQS